MNRFKWNSIKKQIAMLRESAGNNQKELQFFFTQEKQIMIDKLSNLIDSQRKQIRILEAQLKGDPLDCESEDDD